MPFSKIFFKKTVTFCAMLLLPISVAIAQNDNMGRDRYLEQPITSQDTQELSQDGQTSPVAPSQNGIEEIPMTLSVDMEDKPIVRIRILNKITAQTRSYNLKVNNPVSFDGLNIQPRSCKKAPPISRPESASFLEIWETPPNEDEPKWVFSGWMFASSPGLSAMDHPVYDVWVLDCLDEKSRKTQNLDEEQENEDASSSSEDEAQDQAE